MTTDWNLTTLLAALGGVVLVGLLAQGWWSARKAGPRRAEPPRPGERPRRRPSPSPVRLSSAGPVVSTANSPRCTRTPTRSWTSRTPSS